MSGAAQKALTGLDSVLSHTTVKYLDRARAYPFVKWVGGKRALVPEIVKLLPQTFNRYWEPFAGGGAVFFALDSRITQATLSDVNLDLVLAYRIVQNRPVELIRELKAHKAQHNKKHYATIRNQHALEDPVARAARFIYLNKTCYNGLWRVNKQGKFNVPIGSYKNPAICDEDNIRNASDVLEKAVIRKQSFERIEPQSGDLVYCDPPYDETFNGYTGKGFGPDKQALLRDRCKAWAAAGAHVIVSSSDTPLIRSLYNHNFAVTEVKARRAVNCKANGRGPTAELLITA